jgi:TRAP-type C4-dicarboxylate transport system permease small subunit
MAGPDHRDGDAGPPAHPEGGRLLERFDRRLVWANRFVVGALMLAMTLLVFANVVLRYLFGNSLPWVEELTRYMMIWLAYLGAGLALRAGTHVAVEILQDVMPEPAVTALRSVIAALVVVFLAAVAWYGFAYAQFAMRQTSAVLRLPLGLVYLGVPIGCTLMGIHLLLDLRRYLRRDFDVPAPAAETDPEILTVATHDQERA